MTHSQKPKKTFSKIRDSLSTCDYPDTHWKAITLISKYTGKDVKYVENVINAFFGVWGLKYFITRFKKVSIRNFGTFYFHKKTLEAERNRKEIMELNHKIMRHKCKTDQRRREKLKKKL